MTSDHKSLVEFSMEEMIVVASTLQAIMQGREVAQTEYRNRILGKVKSRLAIRYAEMNEAFGEDDE